MSAYAICVRDGQVLLARWTDDQGRPEWTLPGGGTEYGEDPYDTVLREVEEETGYRVEVTGLLGVCSRLFTFRRRFGREAGRHGVGIVYEARVVGGELRFEVNGSTDMAQWHDLDAVSGLNRVRLVDQGLRLWRERPVTGRPGTEGGE
nr:NUDIX hydrolase [Streptomyces sp. SID13726]